MNSCPCWFQGTTLDFIECAPCPPPMLNYSQFREHALSRHVCLTEICGIARRCRPEDPEVGAHCFPVSSTTVNSTRNRTTNSSVSTTGYTPAQPLSEDKRDSTLIIIYITVIVITVVALITTYAVWRRQKSKPVKDHETAQNSENWRATDERLLHEASKSLENVVLLDIPTADTLNSINPASPLCKEKQTEMTMTQTVLMTKL